MLSLFKTLCALIFLFAAQNIAADTRVVNSTSNDANTVGTLPYWLLNANDGDIIDCNAIAGQTILLTSSLPAITKNYTIDGAGIIIDGVSTYQAFQVASGTIVINNIRIQNALSKGGNGGDGYSGGGGAVGGGGALYVHGDTSVTLTAASLVNNIAQGGNGGSADANGNAGAGGGGGFGGGNGGTCLTIVSTGGGGGGHSNGGEGGSNFSTNGSNGTYFGGGGGGAGINSVAPGGSGGNANPNGTFIGGSQSSGNGGGGAGDSQDGYSATGSGSSGAPGNGANGIGTDLLFGGGGAGGTASESGLSGGTGLGAGGGGGAANFTGGAGGILGGGGGGGLSGVGGEGGFGAGGGGATVGGIGGGGYNAGGGNGASSPSGIAAGGGGSGLGGAIFVQNGANLTIIDALEISNNNALAGSGGTSTSASDPNYIPAGDGFGMGYDIFVRDQGVIVFDISNTLTLVNPIEGDRSSGANFSLGLQKIGQGNLNLNGANTYSGITAIDRGTLNLNGSITSDIHIGAEGRLSGNANIFGNLVNSGTGIVHADIDSNGGTSLITVTGTASLAGTLELGIDPNAGTGTYTVMTAFPIANAFNNIAFTGITPVNYSVSYLPGQVQFNILKLNGSSVSGKGSITGASGAIMFRVQATYNARNQIVADMFYNDPAARIHFNNPVVTSLIFSGNSVILGGTARVQNRQMTFNAAITGGNPGALSLALSNGYSVHGNLTSGGIVVQ